MSGANYANRTPSGLNLDSMLAGGFTQQQRDQSASEALRPSAASFLLFDLAAVDGGGAGCLLNNVGP